MSTPFSSQEERSSARRVNLPCFIFFLIAGLLSTCSAHNNSPTYTPIPTESLPDTSKDEQGEIIRKYGLPVKAFQGPLNTTRWIYCTDPQKAIIIEFDAQGEILLKYIRNDTRLCPVTRPEKHIENWPRQSDPKYRNIGLAPLYSPHCLRDWQWY